MSGDQGDKKMDIIAKFLGIPTKLIPKGVVPSTAVSLHEKYHATNYAACPILILILIAKHQVFSS
jgi:hypothetical protein